MTEVQSEEIVDCGTVKFDDFTIYAFKIKHEKWYAKKINTEFL